MHAEAYQAVAERAAATGLDTRPVVALDLGGQFVNGSTRPLFKRARWTGLDIVPGPGIDIVADATAWTPDKLYGLVVCTEVLEHVQDWQSIVCTAAEALEPGGTLILTCASTNRPPHSSVGDVNLGGEWYGNVDPDELRDFASGLFETVDVEYNFPPGDAYMVAVKAEDK